MTIQTVNFGSASDGSQGDTARAGFGKLNQNFTDQSNAASRQVGTAAGNLMEVGTFGLGKNADWRSQNAGKAAGTPTDVVAFGLRSGLADGGQNGLAIPGLSGTFYGCLSYDVQWNDLTALPAMTRRFQTGDRCFISSAASSTAWTPWREVMYFGASPTFSGYMTVSRTDAYDTGIDIQGPAGKPRYVIFRTGSNARFYFGTDGSTEGGGNAGSNFFIDRYSDAGTYLGKPLQINRSTGQTVLESLAVTGPVRVGQYTLASLPSASAFTGHEIDVTDAAGGAKRCRSDGTNWKILNTTTTVS